MPFLGVGSVPFHQSLEVHRVYIVGVDTRAGSKDVAEVLNQLLEGIGWDFVVDDWRHFSGLVVEERHFGAGFDHKLIVQEHKRT